MAQAKRKSKTKTSAGETSQPVDGVLVAITPGSGEQQIRPLGDTRMTEVPTLLRHAAKQYERELGID